MLGGPGGEDPETTKRMADVQVKFSFIQFVIAVGLINLGRNRNFSIEKPFFSDFLAPYAIEALMGENVR